MVYFSFKYPDIPRLPDKYHWVKSILETPGGHDNICLKWFKFLQNTDVLLNIK